MGMMIDIDDFYKRYMAHAEFKAEAEFNQILREIKKTESTSKDDSTTQSKNNSAEMTIDDTKAYLYMQEPYALGKDYRALENALDIIRKYEKIEKIVKEWNEKTENELRSFDAIIQIDKVIGNGNDD